MHKRSLLFVVTISTLSLTALGCKKGAEVAPDASMAETTSATTSTADTSPKQDAAPPATASAKLDRRGAALAMGCPEDKITDDGCDSCAGAWSVEEEDDGGLVQRLTLRPGTYSDSGKAQVYITYFGCGSRAGGDSHNVLLERDEDAWKVARRATYKDNQTCEYLAQADGIEHVLCVNVSGSQGVEYQELTSPGFSNFKGIDATGDEPRELEFDTVGGLVFAFTSNEEMEEDEDGLLPAAPEIKIVSVEDIDNDGDQDARVLIDGESYNLVLDDKARTLTLTKP